MKYYDIDDYIEHKDNSIKPLLAHLRKIIMLAHPSIREQISWNTPFLLLLRPSLFFQRYQANESCGSLFCQRFLFEQ